MKWLVVLFVWFLSAGGFALLIGHILRRQMEDKVVSAWDDEATRNLR